MPDKIETVHVSDGKSVNLFVDVDGSVKLWRLTAFKPSSVRRGETDVAGLFPGPTNTKYVAGFDFSKADPWLAALDFSEKDRSQIKEKLRNMMDE